MKLLLDILQGLGLASASGLRPFLPALTAGGFALGDLWVDYEKTPFSFLEAPWWLVLMAVGLVASLILGRGGRAAVVDSALGGFGVGIGAILCAGTVADRHPQWWYAPFIGAAVAVLASIVARRLITRVRTRFESKNERGAADMLPLYAEAAGLVVAALSLLLPPLSIVAIGLLGWLLIAGRKRDQGKYAGLRVLK